MVRSAPHLRNPFKGAASSFHRCARKKSMRHCRSKSIRAGLMISSDAHQPPATKPSDLNGQCVLVVEDSWQVGTGLQMLLESWGAEVLGPAATTAEAQRLIAER